MKFWVVPLLSANAAYKYVGSDIYSQAGLDVTGWDRWTASESTAPNGKTCHRLSNPPQSRVPREHMLGLYYEGVRVLLKNNSCLPVEASTTRLSLPASIATYQFHKELKPVWKRFELQPQMQATLLG
eukprot:Gregarina_sp_Poly_1__962@NODE_1234_length_4694_cov_90_419278_g58_i1_p4_GENE_NODE_1234_length_4694_cov_90_419278_g58_i1NODE_1234_length_4694_cov_90_419278_g58_i1_p4_ORF_typecomplete_len127_score4_76_NODE_1234_length_4694_cov_90_419278_g58_i131843564